MITNQAKIKTRKLIFLIPILLSAIAFTTISGCTLTDLEIVISSSQQEPTVPEETIAYLYALQTYEALASTRSIADNMEQTAAAPTQPPTETSSPKLLPTEMIPTTILTPTATQTVSSPTITTAASTSTEQAPTVTNTMSPPTETPAAPSPTITLTHTTVPTPTVTNTKAPSQNNTLCYYGNGQYEVPYNVNGPNLDGDIHYWTAPTYTVPFVVFGWADYAGDYDVDGFFQLNWNEDALFLAVKVQDERYKQFADGASFLYKGDSIEILFDANLCDDFYDGSMNQDDYQIGISPGYVSVDGPKYIYQWYPTSQKLSSIVIGSDRTPEDVTIYEIAIPWSTLGVSNPQPGSAFGFTLSISDNDDKTLELQQTMISSSSNRAFNPNTWGTIILN